jgi:hypothetical protein
MLQSHIIDIDGAFVGAAVRLDRGYRFVATDIRLDDLDGSIWPTLADIQRLARELFDRALPSHECRWARLLSASRLKPSLNDKRHPLPAAPLAGWR